MRKAYATNVTDYQMFDVVTVYLTNHKNAYLTYPVSGLVTEIDDERLTVAYTPANATYSTVACVNPQMVRVIRTARYEG